MTTQTSAYGNRNHYWAAPVVALAMHVLQQGKCNILQLDTDATTPSVWEAEWIFQLGCRSLADSTANMVLFPEPPGGVNAGVVLTRREATPGWQADLAQVATLYLDDQDNEAGRRLLDLLYWTPDHIPEFSSAVLRDAANAQRDAFGGTMFEHFHNYSTVQILMIWVFWGTYTMPYGWGVAQPGKELPTFDTNPNAALFSVNPTWGGGSL